MNAHPTDQLLAPIGTLKNGPGPGGLLLEILASSSKPRSFSPATNFPSWHLQIFFGGTHSDESLTQGSAVIASVSAISRPNHTVK
jgi:hypothetical protein